MSTENTPQASEVTSIDLWIDRVDAVWRQHDVRARDRRLLAAELQRDVEQAIAGGAAIDDVMDRDVERFAREVADAQGVAMATTRRTPSLTQRDLIVTCVGGGVAGAVLTWFFVWPFLLTAVSTASDVAAIILLYGSGLGVTVACAVGAVWWRYREVLESRTGLVPVAVGFVLGGLVSIAPVFVFSTATGYSDAPIVVTVEAALAAGCCAAGIAGTLRVRRTRGQLSRPT